MTGELIPLRAARPTNQLEEAILGGVLDLPDQLELIDAAGLGRDDFENPRIALAWTVARRLAERRLQVVADTVCSAGKNHGLLSESDLPWLQGLQASNALNRAQVLQLAEDLRVVARARAVRQQLQNQIDLIDRGRFHPGHAVGALEAIIHGLATDFAADDTADADLLALNASWDKNIADGKSTLDPTGIRVLDEVIGGLPPNIFFVEGRPGVGKNAFLAGVIKAQLRADAHLPLEKQSRTGLFGLEDGTEWLSRRWMAEDTGIRLRDIGWRKPNEDEAARRDLANDALYPLLKRVQTYRQDTISRPELLRRALRMVFHQGVRRIFIDNLGEVNHVDARARMEYWQGVAETVRVMRNFAFRFGIPVGFLVHDTEDDPRPGHEGPPNPKKMAGGKAAGNRARLVLGLWTKGQALRATVTKANELGAAGMLGPTVEFERDYDAGTITADGGRQIDLKDEAAKERRERKDNAREEAVDESIRRADLKKRRVPPKAAEPEKKPEEPAAQASLLDVPPSPRPEPAQ